MSEVEIETLVTRVKWLCNPASFQHLFYESETAVNILPFSFRGQISDVKCRSLHGM